MALKVESLEEMRAIAETINQYADNAESESNKIAKAIGELNANISGQGVDEALSLLEQSVIANSDNVASLKYVALFIKSQAASYSSNEEIASNTLNGVQNALNSIEI